MIRTVFLTLAALLVCSNLALAAHPDTRSEIENLKKRIQALEAGLDDEPVEEKPFILQALGKILTFSGLLELEASYNKTEGAEEESDLTLATVELSTEVEINDHIGGHIILLYEEGDGSDDSINVDEAVISLSCPKPVFDQTLGFEGGKLYVPFGVFNSTMVSDPLTLELGETRNTAVVFSLTGDLWNLSIGTFNGDTDARDDNDHIDSLVAALDFAVGDHMTFGCSFISDLAESDAELVADKNLYGSSTAAASAFAAVDFENFGFGAEVLGALDKFDQPLVGLSDLSGDQPLAWNVEASWMPTDKAQLTARVEGAEDYQDDVRRYGLTGSYGILNSTVIALEYLLSDPEHDAKSHSMTGQLAFEF